MKKYLLLCLYLFFHFQGLSQAPASDVSVNPYDSISVYQQTAALYQAYLKIKITEWKTYHNSGISGLSVLSSGSNVLDPNAKYLIPVVFHVVSNTGSLNTPDSQIYSQMKVLNSVYQPHGIQFVLAGKKPDGSSFNGILRHTNNSMSNYDVNSDNWNMMDTGNLNPCRYLNIWIVDSLNHSSGTLGFAYNLPVSTQIDGKDGVVIVRWAIGDHNDGGFALNMQSREGKILVHEIGHYLGLLHTYTYGCDMLCGFSVPDSASQYFENDLCWDTPPMNPFIIHPFTNSGCNDTANTCIDYMIYGTEQFDPIHNYMTHEGDSCMNEFTLNQRWRMWTTLDIYRKGLWSGWALTEAGVTDIINPVFYVDKKQVCKNEIVVIKFVNKYPVYNENITIDSNPSRLISTTQDTIQVSFGTSKFYKIKIEYYFNVTSTGLSTILDSAFQVMDCTPVSSTQSNWYFGQYAGITFTPFGVKSNELALDSASLNATGSTITQSSKQGKLLFYGGSLNAASQFKLYNKLHKPLSNGQLLTHSVGVQSSLVLPMDADTNKYIVINSFADNGLRYSVINMQLYGGNGGVDSTKKNLKVQRPNAMTIQGSDTIFQTNAAIAAISKCGGGYWVIVQGSDSSLNHFKVSLFELTSTGSIIFRDSLLMPPSFMTDHHYYKFSSDGGKLGISMADSVAIFDFDRRYGTITLKYKFLPDVGPFCFTTNSQYLYTIEKDTSHTHCYVNYLLCRYNLLNINPPRLIVDSLFHNGVAYDPSFVDLLLATDKKVYLNNYGWEYLSVINSPEASNCDYLYKNIYLPIKPSCGVIPLANGLPNFPVLINDTVNNNISIKTISCKQYCFSNTRCNDKTWSIQNANGIQISTTYNVDTLCYTFSTGGTYYILLIIGNDTFVKSITTALLPFNIYGDDTINYKSYNYDYRTDSPSFYTYKWKIISGGSIVSGTTNNTVTINATDTTPVTLRLIFADQIGGCSDSIDKIIQFKYLSKITNNHVIQPIYAYCSGDSIKETITGSDPIGVTGFYSYQWQISYTGTGGFTNISGATTKDYNSTLVYSTPFIIRRIAYSGSKSDTSSYSTITNIDLNVCANKIWFNDENIPYFSSCPFYVQGTTPLYDLYYWQYSFDTLTWFTFSTSSGVNEVSYHIPVYFDSIYVRRKIDRTRNLYYSNIIMIKPNVQITLQPINAVICDTNFRTGSFNCNLNWAPSYIKWYYYSNSTSSWHTYPFTSGVPFFPSLTNLAISVYDSVKVGFTGYCANGLLCDTLYSTTVVFKQVTASTITSQPSIANVSFAANAIFWVQVSNTSSLFSYQWSVSTNNGLTWTAIPNSNNDSLIVLANQSCMSGNKYRCDINTICNVLTTNGAATLTINTPPPFDLWIKDNDDDTGVEPYNYSGDWGRVFSGHDIWNWWQHSPGAVDTLKHYNPEFSKKKDSNYVYFKIRNKGSGTSIPTKLRLYWSFASSGELWDVNWTENANNMYNSGNGNFTLGREITKNHPFIIPPIAVNDSFVGKVAWFAPNPADYDQKDLRFCFLARIISCDGDEPKSMTYLETTRTGNNADSNNNIATRNMILVDSNSNNLVYNGDGSGGNPINWTRINAETGTATDYTVTIKAADPEFFNTAVVYLHLNDELADAVKVNNNFTGAAKLNPILMKWDVAGDVVLNQLNLIPNAFYKVGLEFKLYEWTLAKTSTKKQLEYTTTFPFSMVQQNAKTKQMFEAVHFLVTIKGVKGLRPDTTTNQKPVKYKVIDNFKFYLQPNPANTVVNIMYQLPQQAQTTITFYDVNGKEVLNVFSNKTEQTGNYIVPVDINKLAAGAYIVKLKVNGKEYSQKLVRIGD